MKDKIKTALEAFFSKYEKISLRKGEVVIRSDEQPSRIHYLKEGFVRQYVISTRGIELTLHVYNPGSFFPMIWALGELPNKYNFEALSDTILYKAKKEEVDKFIKNNPEILYDLLKRLSAGISGLLYRIESGVFDRSSVKIASTLLYLGRHFSEENSDNLKIKLKFTHSDISKIAGLTRETTSIEIKRLVRSGLISYTKRFMTINNPQKLEEIVNSS
ncbi:Crp/Fnr family transcriptional regulator [candidate division WWE3 bacterium]|nr:Crp/Fnr family transcriptional regulator [candidate division WWE3 bacterium]